MAIQLSLESCIEPKVIKSKGDIKAFAVKGAIWPKVLTRCQGLAGPALKDRGVPPEH